MSSTTSHDSTHALPARPKELAMHFDTLHQQYQSAKLGMWLFLAQEILFFAGLFCAYAVYRGNHPEMFHDAHFFLDTKLGAINTVVLLCSSLTAAWSVRCAQLEQRKGLIATIVLTILAACTFMVIKYFEYSHKVHIGAVWGESFGIVDAAHNLPQSLLDAYPGKSAEEVAALLKQNNTGTFFSIYFCMTGLHGIHVLIGIGVYLWLLSRAVKGHFNRKYYAAVDNVALYWHIVDIIWIFLFPLLYLIG
ncbi:MAG: cytochrome c oxidase subunit 3 family protein [Planctomycetes bacterium]|nr:cytochrome c oxidase subunit 3 family protein [Planctomycetota bacterium]